MRRLALVLIAVGLSACAGSADPPARTVVVTAPSRTVVVTAPGPTGAVVTAATWSRLADGQTIDDVTAIIGGPGVLAETRDGGTLGPVDVYTWTGDAPGCAAGIGFAHGRVVALNWYGRCPWDRTSTTR